MTRHLGLVETPVARPVKSYTGTCLLRQEHVERMSGVEIFGVEQTGFICAECLAEAARLLVPLEVSGDTEPAP